MLRNSTAVAREEGVVDGLASPRAVNPGASPGAKNASTSDIAGDVAASIKTVLRALAFGRAEPAAAAAAAATACSAAATFACPRATTEPESSRETRTSDVKHCANTSAASPLLYISHSMLQTCAAVGQQLNPAAATDS